MLLCGQWEDARMDVAAFVISCLSLVVAGLGTWLANARAKEALEESRRAAADASWSKLQEAVQRLVGFDPAAEPINDRLTNLRIAMMELVEKLGDEWKGLDLWLDSERTLGATFGRLVMEQARPDDSIDRRLKSLEPLMSWAQVLSQNLRYLRSKGHDGPALSELTEHARSMTLSVHEQQGWEPPRTSNPRVRPLDEDLPRS